MNTGLRSYYSAIEDFRRARRRAALEEIASRLTGKSSSLLSFEEVRQKLQAKGGESRGLREIPLDAIVGSVGRYNDFTRTFLPRRQSDEERWANVQLAVDQGRFPPIEVYQIGTAYFVLDGNHRVSIARQNGAAHIEAYVTKVTTRVPLSPEVQPDDLIMMAELADFLEQTRLDELRPQADLQVTVPGRYGLLRDHIDVHHYFMELERGQSVPYHESVAHWYDEIYLPVVQTIRDQGILKDFPGRTETDLYLWVSKHHAKLQATLGWAIPPATAASDLVSQHGTRRERVAARIGEKIKDALTLPELETGPPTGQWRREHLPARRDDRLFAEILVAVSGAEIGWVGLEQALAIARRESGRLLGLHVVPTVAQRESEEAQAVKAEFNRRCAASGVSGGLVIDVGEVPATIAARARWADLVVVNLAYPPSAQPLARLRSGFRALVRRSPRPLLAVPGRAYPLTSALLAYDGSSKADEALYVATYLASRWKISLTVIHVLDGASTTPQVLARAQAYLEEHGVQPTLVQEHGAIADAILRVAQTYGSDLIIMGGYGLDPVREVVLGSTVDQVLRARWRPMLICR